MMRFLHNIQDNWVAKVLSLLGAILLWFFVMKEQNPIVDASYTVQVHVQNVNSKYVVENVPSEVKVHLRGPRNSMLTLDPTTLKAYVDLAEVTTGQQNVKIQLIPPSGIAVVDMSPDNVTINVDEYTVKEMPVEVQQIGKVPDDIAVRAIATVPKVVSVSGAKHFVDSVAHVVLKVNMSDRRANFTSSGIMVALTASGQPVDNVTVTPRQGQAQLDLEQIRFEKMLPVTASIIGAVPDGYVVRGITVEPQQVTVNGKESLVKGLTDMKTVDIPLNGQTAPFEGDYDILTNDGYTINPARVHVTVDIRKKGLGDNNNNVKGH